MATLSIGTWSSKCLGCGYDADPYEKAHTTRLGYDPGDGKGCGEVFDAVCSGYTHLEDRIKQMRPDLPYV